MEQYHDRSLLILDLDETLIHTSDNQINGLECVTIVFLAFYETCYVYKRPHFDTFINYCFKHFDVAVWTAASSDYAHQVLKELFKENYDKLCFIFTGERCTRIFKEVTPYTSSFTSPYASPYNYVLKTKDLRKVWKRTFNGKRYNKHKTLIVDDKRFNFIRNHGNGIQIFEWTGECFDNELARLALYLEKLRKTNESWRSIEKRNWRDQIKGI